VNVEFFDPPSSREKFERNLNFLAEALNRGQFIVARGLSHTIDGLKRVRYLPNHRVDLLTVDESTRLNANMMMRFRDRVPAGPMPMPPSGDHPVVASASEEE
jgi:hypothetical protein